jgi:hypothetical protein
VSCWRADGRRAIGPLLAVAAVALLFLPLTPPYDLDVFLRAGAAVIHGWPLYPQPGTAAVYSGSSFVYPYFAALPFVPLAQLPSGLSAHLFFGMSSVAVIAGCAAIAGPDAWVAVIVLSTSFTITGLQLGALSPLLFAGVAFMWRLRERPVAFAVLAAPVVASKLFLAPMLLWPLLAGRNRSFRLAAGAVVLLFGAGFALGPLSPAQYGRLLSALGDHEAGAGFDLVGALRNAGLGSTAAQTIAVGLAAALLAAAYALHRRRGGDERVLFCAGIIASLVLTPVLWGHYLVLLCAVVLTLQAPRRWLVALALAAWIIAPPHGFRAAVDYPDSIRDAPAVLAVAAAVGVFGYAAYRAGVRPGRRRQAPS